MNDPNRPDYESSLHRTQAGGWRICRQAVAGTHGLRADPGAYLDRHPAEARDDWLVRVRNATVPGHMTRTVRGLAGMVFRRDPELVDVPDDLAEQLKEIDGNTHLDVFARRVFEDALQVGHAAILVDAPRSDAPPSNRRHAKELGHRPYWVHVRAEDILSWRSKRVGARLVLTQVVIRGRSLRADGDFGDDVAEVYTILRRGPGGVTWEIQQSDGQQFKVIDSGTYPGLTEIPLAGVYAGNRRGDLVSEPPLIELAHVSIQQARVQSDHLTALHKASVPILTITGAGINSDVAVGPNVGLTLPEGARVEYVEHRGHALDATRQQLQDFQTQAAALGLSMLQRETRAAETAEAKRLDRSEQDSALAAAARSLQDGLNTALAIHGQMIEVAEVGTIGINRDFERLSIDAREIQAYSQLVANGQMSVDTLWNILSEGGALPEGFDPDVERVRIEEDLMIWEKNDE